MKIRLDLIFKMDSIKSKLTRIYNLFLYLSNRIIFLFSLAEQNGNSLHIGDDFQFPDE